MTGTLGLDPTPDEPRPWLVVVWRYGAKSEFPFVSREGAIAEGLARMDDDCYVEGILTPQGEWDDDADKTLRPWAHGG